MDSSAQATFAGFPVAEEPAEKTPWELYRELCQKDGGLIPQTLLSSALGLSKQRISQFVAEKRFVVHQIAGSNYVTGASFERFLREERKNGRPFKPPTLGVMVKAGAQVTKDIVKKAQRK